MATLKVEAVTLDCAGTLVEVRWTLDGFAKDCMTQLGVELPTEAYPRLLALYGESLAAYHSINLTGNASEGEAFWRELTRRWFAEFGVDPSLVTRSREVAGQMMMDPASGYFRLYPDVLDCLSALERMGHRLAIISNWDYTLHPIVHQLGLTPRFEVVLASLEQGFEKPDPRLFEACLKQMNVAAKHTVHVGDDVTDDVEGAISAGITPILLKRSQKPQDKAVFSPKSFVIRSDPYAGTKSAKGAVIASLAELPEVLKSIG